MFKDLIPKLHKLKIKRVFIQLPEGLRHKALELAKTMSLAGIEPIICIEPCYGPCDIREHEAESLGCEALINLGHISLDLPTSLPVLFHPLSFSLKLDWVKKEIEKIQENKIGLVSSLEFIKLIPKIKALVEEKGKKVFVAEGFKLKGLILGCKHRIENLEGKVECILCVSAGKFHALGLLNLNLPIYCLDMERKKIYNLEKERSKVLRLIEWNKSKFKAAQKVGIIVSWKKGQLKNFEQLKRKLEAKGKEVYVLACDEVKPEKIPAGLDFLINLACPRIGIDDLETFDIPLLNPEYLDLDATEDNRTR